MNFQSIHVLAALPCPNCSPSSNLLNFPLNMKTLRIEGTITMSETSAAKTLDRKDLTGPALRTFFRIAEVWSLKEQEQMRLLGLDSRSTFQSWKRGAVASIPKDTLERISYILGIYKGLQILLPETADQWVRKPNRAGIFGGRSALERMASGNVADLYVVRQYIDAQCG